MKIKEKKDKKHLYVVFPIPEIGLHLSFHGIDKEDIHIHMRDGIGLGIHEDIPLSNTIYVSIDEWAEDITQFLYRPTRDSKLLVVPIPTVTEISRWGLSFSKGEFYLDPFALVLKFSEYFYRHAYFVEGEQLLKLLPRLTQRETIAVDLMQEKMVTFHRFKDIFLMLGYNLCGFEDQFRRTKVWKALFAPMDRVLSYAKQKRPQAFEKYGAKDMLMLENLYSDKIDSMLNQIKKRLRSLVERKFIE